MNTPQLAQLIGVVYDIVRVKLANTWSSLQYSVWKCEIKLTERPAKGVTGSKSTFISSILSSGRLLLHPIFVRIYIGRAKLGKAGPRLLSNLISTIMAARSAESSSSDSDSEEQLHASEDNGTTDDESVPSDDENGSLDTLIYETLSSKKEVPIRKVRAYLIFSRRTHLFVSIYVSAECVLK
jgi:hypothetical protein